MDNATIAERLEAFAALLDLNGSGFYTVRAYRRAAELIRSTPADVAALVRTGRARGLAGIGPGIEARLRELVETGRLAELDELEAQALPELVGVARLLGVSSKRMRELGHSLGIRTLPELREAAAAGRLDSVPGIGPKTAARIEQGLADLATARPARGMTLNRAGTLVGEIAAALELGYEYLAICDHTKAVRVVPGLDADDLRRQAGEIAAANELLAPFRILRGSECDILPDGSLDLPDDALAELEWVQISLHAGQRWGRDALTDRVVEAMHHPAARCLSHPKGRILNHRPENALDLERVFEVALATGVALEVNGLPDRLDLSGTHVQEAIAAGVPIVCSTDAHSVRGLRNMALSVTTARRGGAPGAAVLNTRPLDELLRRSA